MTTRLYSLLGVLAFAITLALALAISPPDTNASVSVPFEDISELIVENFESLDGALATGTDFSDTRDVLKLPTGHNHIPASPRLEVSLTAGYRCHNWRIS